MDRNADKRLIDEADIFFLASDVDFYQVYCDYEVQRFSFAFFAVFAFASGPFDVASGKSTLEQRSSWWRSGKRVWRTIFTIVTDLQ